MPFFLTLTVAQECGGVAGALDLDAPVIIIKWATIFWLYRRNALKPDWLAPYDIPPFKPRRLLALLAIPVIVAAGIIIVAEADNCLAYWGWKRHSFRTNVHLTLDAAASTNDFINTCVTAPVFEEIFFRGLLFARLVPLIGGVPAALISSCTFSATHFSTEDALRHAGFGGLMCATYYALGAHPAMLVVPIALHMGVNGLVTHFDSDFQPRNIHDVAASKGRVEILKDIIPSAPLTVQLADYLGVVLPPSLVKQVKSPEFRCDWDADTFWELLQTHPMLAELQQEAATVFGDKTDDRDEYMRVIKTELFSAFERPITHEQLERVYHKVAPYL